MKKALKITVYVIGALALAIIAVLTYVKTMLPSVGEPPVLTVAKAPENVERGRYLANHVMVCADCHSTRDWSVFSGPPVAGTIGKGGERFDQTMGFPGKYVANNITPHHLGSWTDGEIFRAITAGVSKDGRALFSIMPHHNFGQLDRRDIEDVIAYIRTLQPIQFDTEPSESDFPMNFIINTIPAKPVFSTRPSPSNTVAYGKYLVTASGCYDCHTKMEQGKPVGEPFAGGFEMRFPNGAVLRSANITPDVITGIGGWTQEQFVLHFKAFADSGYIPPRVGPADLQTIMPWTMYAGMTEQDLASIYQYLKSLKPVSNAVKRFTLPSK